MKMLRVIIMPVRPETPPGEGLEEVLVLLEGSVVLERGERMGVGCAMMDGWVGEWVMGIAGGLEWFVGSLSFGVGE